MATPTNSNKLVSKLGTSKWPAGEPLIANGARLWIGATLALTIASFVAAISLAPAASDSPSKGIAWLLAIGSSVHVASTIWMYTLPEVRSYAIDHRIRYIWAPISLIVSAALLASLTSPKYFIWPLLGYFSWQFFHFQKQNLGITALTASAHNVASLSARERQALMCTGWTGIVGLVAHPALLQLNLDFNFETAFVVSKIAFVVACISGVVLLFRRSSENRPLGFSAMYLTSLLFSLPIFVFHSPYAAVGGLTIAHGLQYLVLVALVAAGGSDGMRRFMKLAALCNIALIGGVALSAASHLHESGPYIRVFYGAYLGVVMAHFVVDAGLWRLRDPFPRSLIKRHMPYLSSQVR